VTAEGLPPLPGTTVALFLDVDGTILDFSEAPAAVRVPSSLPGIVAAAAKALDGALAFVSGRSIRDLDRLFAPLRLPTAGQHGGEIRPSVGAPTRRMPTEPIGGVMLRRIEMAAHVHPAIEVENKGGTVAVHYRRAPGAAAQLEAALRRAVALDGTRLALMPGNMVWEIKDARYTKATAVELLMRREPFHGRTPLFVGDDITDEDGFMAVERLGGTALAVGAVHSARRRTAFAGPWQVREWLAALPRLLARGAAR
jgi:trehalose 6-phosphate phosphatase